MNEAASTGLDGVLPGGFNASLETPKDAAALAKLKEACGKAFKDHNGSCSHAVNAILRTMLGLTEAAWPQRQANDLVAFLAQSTDWTAVTLDRANELALQGLAVKGSYPLALSTSLGAWPGAKSNRDKTVRDPWGNDDAFALVTFWAPAKAAAAGSRISAGYCEKVGRARGRVRQGHRNAGCFPDAGSTACPAAGRRARRPGCSARPHWRQVKTNRRRCWPARSVSV